MAEVVKTVRLKDGLVLLELFHGRTLAFKDLAMTCTVSFINYLLQKEKRRATVVVGERRAAVDGRTPAGEACLKDVLPVHSVF